MAAVGKSLQPNPECKPTNLPEKKKKTIPVEDPKKF